MGFDFLYLSSLIPSSSHTPWVPLVMNSSLSPSMLYFRNCVPFIYYLLSNDDRRNSHFFFKILFTFISSIKVLLIPLSFPQSFSLNHHTSTILYWKCLHGANLCAPVGRDHIISISKAVSLSKESSGFLINVWEMKKEIAEWHVNYMSLNFLYRQSWRTPHYTFYIIGENSKYLDYVCGTRFPGPQIICFLSFWICFITEETLSPFILSENKCCV